MSVATPQAVEEIIAELKGSGFWLDGTERRLRTVARDLLIAGVSDELIAETISEMWSIVRSEYGE